VSRHEYSLQDARDLLDVAVRHTLAYQDGSSHAELTHAIGAWDRLSSAVEALRAPLVEARFKRQTDDADTLAIVWAEGAGDREYGFNPDGGA
jgi:hypothetical protein